MELFFHFSLTSKYSWALRKLVLQHFSKKPSNWNPLLTAVNGCRWADTRAGRKGAKNNSTAAFFRIQSFLMLERSLRNWSTALWKQKGLERRGPLDRCPHAPVLWRQVLQGLSQKPGIWEGLKQEVERQGKGDWCWRRTELTLCMQGDGLFVPGLCPGGALWGYLFLVCVFNVFHSVGFIRSYHGRETILDIFLFRNLLPWLLVLPGWGCLLLPFCSTCFL